MNQQRNIQPTTDNIHRKQLLDGLPVSEQRLKIAGINTAILEGGKGHPIVLLHGPGESAFWWMQVIPGLVKTHRVIVPDLPGHGESGVTDNTLGKEQVINWLGELISKTCQFPPILTGHVLGGSIAARFAINNAKQVHQLLLVDSLGLARFRPAPLFAYRLIRFMINPNEKTYSRFLPECMYNVGHLRSLMGEKWDPFLAYNLENAQKPEKKAALKTLMKSVGVPKIPEEGLAKISVPVSLIWGRHDRANKLKIAEAASNKFGWPLQVIENSGDDPKLEQPQTFLRALYSEIDSELAAADIKPENTIRPGASNQKSRGIIQ